MDNTLRYVYEQPQPQTLGSLVEGDSRFDNLHYRNLIKCLSWYESSWRPYVKGDKNQSWGAMQFYRPWDKNSLWRLECVPRGYNNPFDFQQAIECTDEILQEDFSKVCRWSTANKCGINCR